MDKRKKILDAALKLFTEFGFHGTPTSKIAQEAGVANGTLFHHFRSKEELVIELYKTVKANSGEYISQGFDEQTEVKDKIRHIFLNYIYWALENEAKAQFMEQFKTSPYVANIPKEELHAETQIHLEPIEQGIRDGTIKLKDLDYIVMLCVTHAYGLHSYLLQNDFSKSKQHQVIDETFELLWKMLT